MTQLLAWLLLIFGGAFVFVSIIRLDEWLDRRKERPWKR